MKNANINNIYNNNNIISYMSNTLTKKTKNTTIKILDMRLDTKMCKKKNI